MGPTKHIKVVNVKVSHIRPKYKNLEDWMSDPDNVYIGRKNVVFIGGTRYPHEDSPFANPFKIGRQGSRAEVMKKYRKYIAQKIEEGHITDDQLLALRGKNLGCWCVPLSCHGDILREIVDSLPQNK